MQYKSTYKHDVLFQSKMTTIKFSSSLSGDPEDLLQQAVHISDGDTDEETGTENIFLIVIYVWDHRLSGVYKKGGLWILSPPPKGVHRINLGGGGQNLNCKIKTFGF